MIHFKDTKSKSALSTRWAQMTKQEQIIEKKKMEIQAKLEAQKQAAALAAQAKLANICNKDEKNSANIFSNDGSFMSQFKTLLEKQAREKREKEELEKQRRDEEERKAKEAKKKAEASLEREERDEREQTQDQDEHLPGERSREKHHRWSNRGRNHDHSPITIEDRKKLDKSIPSLMQIPVRPPGENPNDSPESSSHNHQTWPNFQPPPESNDDSNDHDDDSQELGPMGPQMGPGPMGPGPMGPGPIVPGPMVPGPMGQGPMGPGPWGTGPNITMMPNMGPGPGPNMGMGPGMGPGPMPPGNMGPGPNMPPLPPSNMGPGPNMGPGGPNMGPGGPNMGPGGPNMGPGGPNMGPGGPNMGPMMRPGGPNMPPMPPPPNGPPGGLMPPFMGGPPNFPMPPNFMGPNGPCGPGPMPPNMCGTNMRGPGPNGPMPPFCGPFPNGPFMGPNGPPNSMMPPNSNNGNMPFMGPRPPFGPNGPNFGPNGPPNMPPFMPPNSMQMQNNMPEQKPLDNIPPPEPMKLQNIPPPMPLPLNHIPKPKDLDPGNIPAPPKSSQVLSPDMFPPSVQRAASEVAANGDHWENVLKAIHSQDQNMWFLHNQNSGEYKAFRELVNKLRVDNQPEVKPEDKYEPEFCLDDDSNDSRPAVKEESRESYADSNSQPIWNFNQRSSIKREQASSQSDEEPEVKRERRKKRKSRWGDDPPAADIKPPGVVAPMPGMLAPLPGVMAPLPGMPALPLPGMHLAKVENDGVKLTTVNRNNPALMQYAMTNYGTTNLNAEDWKKCEDNFKLNLLYQDMMKKRQEVERLAAMGKHKYEYDSDEDTSEGTWEHRLRAKEMFATEKWATELTKQAAGKHHIGDFLPPEELKKFMEKYSAAKGGKEPDLSDYKEFKLKEDNVGFKMLQKLGWTEGQGLGAEGSGIVDPINKSNQPVAGMGLGAAVSDVVSPDDDEFDAYRKRMMLAYRFRPNPLNNPRRPYY